MVFAILKFFIKTLHSALRCNNSSLIFANASRELLERSYVYEYNNRFCILTKLVIPKSLILTRTNFLNNRQFDYCIEIIKQHVITFAIFVDC